MGEGDKAQRKDGRRERSASSRARIVAAMLDLVERGDLAPSAARVADEAQVGLRTVFRHFDDMESLFKQMSESITARVMPEVAKPFEASDWQGKLREMALRRARVFEMMLPYRLSANLRRYQSPFLMDDYNRTIKMERQLVEAVLPAELRSDSIGIEALVVALSFQSWRVMRYDQRLSPEHATAVLRRLVDNAIAGFDS
jgi:AcrR family transcriptional regulator